MCPLSHPFSFLQNNWCCSINKESKTSISYLEDYCNGGDLDEASMCCAGDSVECQDKPCFDNPTNFGKDEK